MKSTVYKDFFTNVSVAWFTAGVIAPFFTPFTTLRNITASIISAIMSFGSLMLAIRFEKDDN